MCGYQDGYNIENEKLIEKINDLLPDILIVGLGCPKQEEWIVKFKDYLNVKIILAVGDGIKVFAGTKIRGSNLFRTSGLEWFIRLITNPSRYWKRYLLGIPLFIIRVIKFKLSVKV
ncbi:MAG: WecB/TagA/CpsF family glycosyltransferase [Ignavibacteriaceae bacterium]